MWVALPEWGACCQGRRTWWKEAERRGAKICPNWWGLVWILEAQCQFCFLVPFSWACFQLCWRKVLKFLFRSTLWAAGADQQVQIRALPVVLEKTDKSFLSWAISLRYAKAKGWIAFLSGLDFVSGPVCSVGVYKDSVYSSCAKTYYLFCAEPRTPWRNTQVPGYTFVVMVMLSMAKLQRLCCCIFFCCKWDCPCTDGVDPVLCTGVFKLSQVRQTP